ncbi:MAG: tRNA (adenosine(37)-N6)-threonylcarbamoyltransferase complex transferase subunit TsaD [Clostridiales bacterium]|nr:tRNA (adenosine(37)-N6)-threonylcarbamoyltransferase complex transferase subunit TsaD [Clostridiales bacterium]
MALILGIESSCDETAAAVVENGRIVHSNIIASQIDIHRLYGGVVPELASRHHLQAIMPVTAAALTEAGLSFAELDAVAVSFGPGLAGALLVGVSYAKALAFVLKKPLIAVHHWQAHIAAIGLDHEIEPPYLALVVSGSHSGLAMVTAQGVNLIGQSLDDAAGEAFDKIARALGLPYPGGPEIEKAARQGRRDFCAFPRAVLENPYDFSFSGLKSAVLNELNRRQMRGETLTEQLVCDIAASAEEAICDTLSAKAVAAARAAGQATIVLVGGVAANSRLRELLLARARAAWLDAIWPRKIYCTDNAAMVGAAAYTQWQQKSFADATLNAAPRLTFA